MAVDTVVFDAYGTLFDVYGVEAACEEAYSGSGKEIGITWRQKQLEYTWLRSLMGRYENFDRVTRAALVFTLEKMGHHYNGHKIDTLTALYLQLPMYQETRQVLAALKPRRLAILSNGTVKSLQQVVGYNELTEMFDAVLSVDQLGVYKPKPEVYQFAVDELQTAKGNILFVSSNGWDVAGAKSYGFRTTWVNRPGLPQEKLDVEADFVVKDLQGLLQVVGSLEEE